MNKIILTIVVATLFSLIACILITYYAVVFYHYLMERKCGLHICAWCSNREMCDWPNRKK